ncbi:carnitine transporter [Dispira parvispora]|uniref:Carnitine transporter n=1 Tax=Dispira parvispora TaxID=1520584 RepID=A0A9W8E7E4_9FUNG|nr:carnitine transporter [Dispira parvispora]
MGFFMWVWHAPNYGTTQEDLETVDIAKDELLLTNKSKPPVDPIQPVVTPVPPIQQQEAYEKVIKEFTKAEVVKEEPVSEPVNPKLRTMGLDDIYVINLKSRPDRRASMLLQGDFLDLKFKFTEAAVPDTVGYVPPLKTRSKSMSPHRLACWRSHMNILQDIIERNLTHALILEDDVDLDMSLPRDIPQALAKLPEDWDTFYIGHCSLTENRGQVIDQNLGLYRSNAPYCAHAYVVSHKGARHLFYHLRTAATAIDLHIIGLINAKFISSYSFHPPRVVQPRAEGDKSDIPESTNLPPNQRLAHSTLQAVKRYSFGNDRPCTLLPHFYYMSTTDSLPNTPPGLSFPSVLTTGNDNTVASSKHDPPPEHIPSDSTAKSFIAGAVGGVGMILAGHPFDLIKVRQQTIPYRITPLDRNSSFTSAPKPHQNLGLSRWVTQHWAAFRASHVRGPSTWSLVQRTWTTGGFRGFYRGVLPPLITATPIVALSFWGYDVGLRLAQSILPTPEHPFNHHVPGVNLERVPRADQLSLWQIAVAGSFSAIIPAFLLGPMERVKVAMQVMDPHRSVVPRNPPAQVLVVAGGHVPTPASSTWEVTKSIYRQGGLASVMRGTMGTLARDLPGNCFYFLTYEIFCRHWSLRFNEGNTEAINPWAIFVFGGFAGLAEGITTLPIDTLKSRLQSAKEGEYPRGMRDVFRTLWAKEGPTAMFRGFVPTLLWAFPANAATFLCMELTHRFLDEIW